MTKVVLVCPHIGEGAGYARDFTRLDRELCALGVETRSVAYGVTNASGMAGKWRLLRELRRRLKGADLVHFVGFFFPEYLPGSQAAIAAGLPYLISPLSHLQCFALQRSRIKKRLFLLFGGLRFLTRASAIHSFGSSETESVVNLGFRGDIFEISLGIHEEDLQTDAAPIGLQKSTEGSSTPQFGQRYVLFFGRLDVFQKGLDLLLEGFELYCKRNPRGLNLIIAGRAWEGSDRWLQSRVSAMSCGNRIALQGEVTDQAKFDLIKNARALIYPSRFDGPPRPLRDAIAAGVFVLASRQSNIHPELEVRGLGRFFDANRVSIAAAMEGLQTGAALSPRGSGRRLLDWNGLAQRYALMYRAILENSTSTVRHPTLTLRLR